MSRSISLRPLRSLRIVVVGALALGLLLAAVSTASAAGGPYYWIVPEHGIDKALQVNDASKSANWWIVQNTLGNFGAQHWKISGPQGYDAHGGSLRYFQNRHSRMCISGTDYHPNIPDARPGSPFIQRWCTFGSAPTVEETQSQRFWVSNTAAMWAGRPFTMRNEKSGLCVDVEGASRAEDAPAVQYGCYGLSNQRFRLMYAGS